VGRSKTKRLQTEKKTNKFRKMTGGWPVHGEKQGGDLGFQWVATVKEKNTANTPKTREELKGRTLTASKKKNQKKKNKHQKIRQQKTKKGRGSGHTEVIEHQTGRCNGKIASKTGKNLDIWGCSQEAKKKRESAGLEEHKTEYPQKKNGLVQMQKNRGPDRKRQKNGSIAKTKHLHITKSKKGKKLGRVGEPKIKEDRTGKRNQKQQKKSAKKTEGTKRKHKMNSNENIRELKLVKTGRPKRKKERKKEQKKGDHTMRAQKYWVNGEAEKKKKKTGGCEEVNIIGLI